MLMVGDYFLPALVPCAPVAPPVVQLAVDLWFPHLPLAPTVVGFGLVREQVGVVLPPPVPTEGIR